MFFFTNINFKVENYTEIVFIISDHCTNSVNRYGLYLSESFKFLNYFSKVTTPLNF